MLTDVFEFGDERPRVAKIPRLVTSVASMLSSLTQYRYSPGRTIAANVARW
jgi:hypothetical protein